MALVPAVSSQSIWKFSPQTIPGLMLWLDGADSNTITYGVSPKVSSWRDKSVNGYNATQATSGNQPSFGGSGVAFATSTYLTTSYTAAPATETVFIVVNPTTVSGGPFDMVATTATGGRAISIYLSLVSTSPTGSAISCSAPAITAGTTILVEMTYAGTGVSVLEYYNGALQADTATGTVSFSGAGTTQIGASLTDVSAINFFSGTIYEIICYNTVLTAIQRQQVEGYLAWKWKLQTSLPSTHPYKSSLGIIPFSRTFSPNDISGCQLWLDATDSSTITLSGSNVIGWKDKSGNGNNATGTTNTSIYPVVSNINSVQAMSLAGVTGGGPYFTGAVSITGTTLTCFAVATTTISLPNGGRDQRLVSLENGSNVDYGRTDGAIALFNQGTTSTIATYRVSGPLASSAIVKNTPFQTVSLYDGAKAYIWKDGTSGTPTAGTASTGTFAITNYGIGNQANPTTETWIGYIGEVIIYNTNLTSTQRQQVEGYLAWKWKLQANLPATAPIHPFKNYYPSTPTPFNPNVVTPAAWFDAADSSTISYTSSNLTGWSDKCGNGFNLSCGSPYPTYSTNSKNRLSTISFSSSNPFVMSTSGNANIVLNDFSIFGVFYLAPNSTTQPLAVKGSAAPFINLSLTSANKVSLTYQPAATLYTIASGVVTTGWYIISAVVNRSTAAISSNYINLNGVNSGSSATSSTATVNNSSVWTIGASPFIGNIGELIILNLTTTSNQCQQIEGYLSYKWGITLPTTHPYYNFSP